MVPNINTCGRNLNLWCIRDEKINSYVILLATFAGASTFHTCYQIMLNTKSFKVII